VGEASGILQHYTFKDIGHILAAVGSIFQVLVDFTPFDYVGWGHGVIEQLSQSGMLHIVSFVFQAVHLDARLENQRELVTAAQTGQHLAQFIGYPGYD